MRAYDESDLSQREFARREGVNLQTFVKWLQRPRRSAGAKPPPRFRELSLPFTPTTSSTVATASLEVQLADGTTIRGRNVEEIAQLLRLIRC